MKRQSQRGFTLLELMLTLTVTTIGLIGLLSLHLSIARGNAAPKARRSRTRRSSSFAPPASPT